jgi:RNA polymerase sigma-70 factor (ECF subfamily)
VNNGFKHITDTQLALLAQRGDSAAFGEIFNRHAPGIARTLASFAGADHSALDDLVQDVFMRVIERLSTYSPTHPFPKWLYTIALNVGRNHVRSRSRTCLVEPGDISAFSDDLSFRNDPTSSPLAAEAMRLVSLLPDTQQEVVAVRIGDNLSYGEIGEILGITEGAARSRMHSAVTILREKLHINHSPKDKES